MRRLITDFRRGDLSGRCRYPLRLEKVPQISQIYTDFFIGVFCHADFADDADFLFIGWHGIYSEIFLMRRLLTDFRGGDLSGRCRYPLRSEYVPQISQIYTDFYSSDDTEFIRRYSCGGDYSRIFTEATYPVGADTHWEWTKRFNWDSIKNLCISVKSVGQNNPHKEKSVYICEICGTK